MLRASSRGLCATLSYRVTGWQCAARTMSTRMGYTLSPYEDADREGYRRGSEFCLLTLQHPEYDVDDTMELRELYTEKADVYSCCIVMWEMATGVKPFRTVPVQELSKPEVRLIS